MEFTDNVYKTLFTVLKRVDPSASYENAFGTYSIDLTVLREEQLPSCLDNQVMVNQNADIIVMDEVEELDEKPPRFLEDILSDQSSISILRKEGIDEYGCMLLFIERLVYLLNEHLQEYQTSYLWPDSYPEITPFSTQTHVHTGLCCLLHNTLQSSYVILTSNYPSWLTTILNVIPEAFSFRERHSFLFVFISSLISRDSAGFNSVHAMNSLSDRFEWRSFRGKRFISSVHFSNSLHI